MDNSQVVHSFKKNSTETVCFSLGEFKGLNLFDVRLYFTDQEGNLKPTPKGISLRVEKFDEFKAGVNTLRKALQKKNEETGTNAIENE